MKPFDQQPSDTAMPDAHFGLGVASRDGARLTCRAKWGEIGHILLAGVFGLVAGSLHSIGEEGGVAGKGFRFREVAPQGAGAGFKLLPGSQTGVTVTNHLSDARAAENQIRLNGSGVALGDVDNDGWCDIYLCGLEGDNTLYRNLGGWRFEDVTARAGVACAGEYSSGAVIADVTGDGALDLLVTGVGVGTRLFLNGGDGRFRESQESGLVRKGAATSLALADVDGDGDLDLYVVNYRSTTIRSTGLDMINLGGRRVLRPEDRLDYEITPQGRVLEHGEPDFLYRNEGAGRFTVMSWTGGVFRDESGRALPGPPRDWGLTAMFRDIDRDGWPDLYVCNDFHSPDRIWMNDRQGGFRAMESPAIRHTSTFSMSVDFADIDRDGSDDLIVADMLSRDHARRLMQVAAEEPEPWRRGEYRNRPQYGRNVLQRNRGDGTFEEIAAYAGLEATDWTWSVMFMDVDLDGYEDLLCSTGHLFDTQDLDADARVRAMGPQPRDRVHLKLLQYPRLSLPRVAFRNRGNLTFEECSATWGFNQAGAAHGMACGDLDNDGDLDVVVNDLNAETRLYRNDTPAGRLAIRLKGEPTNRWGVGSRIRVSGGELPVQEQEMIAGGRYLSGDEAVRVFAAGNGEGLAVEVRWRDGRISALSGVRANAVYEIDQATAQRVESVAPVPAPTLFVDVSERLRHVHQEADFDEYARQPLLPRGLMGAGPGISWFDVDGNGWEDLIIGGGKGGQLMVFRNDTRGGFLPGGGGMDFKQPLTRDQTAVLGWHPRQGETELLAGSSNYRDGLSVGSAVRRYGVSSGLVRDDLPGSPASTGALALGDFDADGDLDLFIGGRVVPGRYPEPAPSRLLRNRDGVLEEDPAAAQALSSAGLVNGAVWSDLDGDGRPELVLACEWGPVRVFGVAEGRWVERTGALGLEGYKGWWTGVTTGDFDGDGRMDLAVGNLGLNTKFQSHLSESVHLYYGDYDRNGTHELVEVYFDGARKRNVPWRDRDAVAKGLPWVVETFPTYAAYGEAGIDALLGGHAAETRTVTVSVAASGVFLNRGARFDFRPFPGEAQRSAIFGLAVADFDGDGREDLVGSQNLFDVEPSAARLDAGLGVCLLGDGRGGFTAMTATRSGMRVFGEGRGTAVSDFDGDGRPDLAMGQNSGETRLFRNQGGQAGLRVRLKGPVGNPNGIGAVVRQGVGGGWGPAREVHAGSGYWSQDGSVVVLGGARADRVQVRWPGGAVTTADVPSGASELTVTASAPRGEPR